ncbi:MAG: hypothetical protein KGS45_13440 [Planctomycetes bacterium]|nr:hypothetical protein [Planctomycetota bacterium]
MKVTSKLLWLAGALMVTSEASAQVVTPPTEGRAPTPAYVPPPPPPTPKPFEGAQPSEAQPTTPPPAAPVTLPSLPYKSLAEKGADGKLVALTEPIYVAALRVNPTVTDDERSKIEPYLKTRRESYEQIAIDNIDFLQEIDNGLVDKLNMADPNDAKKVQKIRALAGKGTLSAALRDAKLLSETQIRFGDKIVKERNEAEIAELKAAAGSKEGDKKAAADVVTPHLMRQAVSESLMARRGLFLELANNLTKVEGSLGLDAAAFGSLKTAVAAAKDDASKVAAVQGVFKGLNADQARAALKAVVAARGK